MAATATTLCSALGDWSGPGPAHRRLAERLRLLVLDGRLPLGTALPGERDLAATLGVSRTTVTSAYASLRDAGYLAGRDRARSRVTLPRPPAATGHRSAPPTGFAAGGAAGRLDLARAAPPAPGRALRAAYDTALEQLPRHLPGVGYAGAGLPELRAAVAERYTQRGLPTRPEQILVTSGAQHAIALLARTLLRPGARVVVEHPTYPHALATLRAAGARLRPVPVTRDGWDLDALHAAARDADLAYLQPDHHNPTGLRLPEAERDRLRLRLPVVVDETMAELALDGARPSPLAAGLPHAISVGSASKTFWGGLRVGWIRADPASIARLAQARPLLDLGTPVVEQLACAALLHDADAVLAERLPDLRARRARLLELLATELPALDPWPSAGGLAVWAQLPAPVSSALAGVAPAHGVSLAAGPRFGVGGAFERHLRLPHVLDPEPLAVAIRGLRAALDDVLAGRRADLVPADLV